MCGGVGEGRVESRNSWSGEGRKGLGEGYTQAFVSSTTKTCACMRCYERVLAGGSVEKKV